MTYIINRMYRAIFLSRSKYPYKVYKFVGILEFHQDQVLPTKYGRDEIQIHFDTDV
jgi:hypothetical protein